MRIQARQQRQLSDIQRGSKIRVHGSDVSPISPYGDVQRALAKVYSKGYSIVSTTAIFMAMKAIITRLGN